VTLPSFNLQGRPALVTGASSGLGHHFAMLLAEAGAPVALAARRVDRLAVLADAIAAKGGRAVAIACDVTQGESVRAAIGAAEAALGPVGILVNNAGVAVPKPLFEQTEADWDLVVDTNLKGAWLVAQAAAERMVAAGRGGRIVNIASVLGLRTIATLPAYTAAKAGLIHLTRVLAMEWARHGITVNALAPGYFATEMNRDFLESSLGQKLQSRIPMRRFGRVEDIDGALLLLAAEAGQYITGTVIPVDGGHLVASL
jgi:NAD(P)-dependent dehydrogenase (short-subunit alcohol dehydrogenase family)